MIEDEKYEELLSSGLSLDHYFLLCNIQRGIQPIPNRRIQGFMNLLNKKEYIKDDAITQKALDLIGNLGEIPKKVSETYTNFQVWVKDLHEACQQLLIDLTGKKQVIDRIGKGKAFPFLPNLSDFSNKLSKAISQYKLKDLEKVRKTVLRHITNCSDAKSWFPLMQYYILKDGSSQMVTDMDTIEDQQEEGYRSNQKLL